jgi:hypothetical protein
VNLKSQFKGQWEITTSTVLIHSVFLVKLSLTFSRFQSSLGIGVIDEYLQYSPAYYTNGGYVYDFYLMCQKDCFGEGDTIGYGIDWNREEQFITINGVRSK